MATKSLSKLKIEMIFNTDLAKLVDVMKGVAASQYHVMERKKTPTEQFSKALNELFEAYDFRHVAHPFLYPQNKKKLIVVITTDSGFLGGLNMKVLQAATGQEEKGCRFLIIGERGVNFAREFGKTYTAFPGINVDDSRYTLADKVSQQIISQIISGDYGRAILAYPYAISFTAQRVELLNLIPCPLFFKNKPKEVPGFELQQKDCIQESTAEQMIIYLTQLWIKKRLIECFESAKMAEFGARTMHLEEAYQTLKKIDTKLKLDYFKARREKIDQSLRETFTSQLMIGE